MKVNEGTPGGAKMLSVELEDGSQGLSPHHFGRFTTLATFHVATEGYGSPRGHPHFLLANRLHFDFTEMLYVYRHLYCDNHAV
jgi:hypothetical protein